jgi:hypothetical protein
VNSFISTTLTVVGAGHKRASRAAEYAERALRQPREQLAFVRMGQPVAVTLKRSVEPGRVRFEMNRSLTGQGHESYDQSPPRTETFGAVLAQRLFATGLVRQVHVYSSVVTVDMVPGANAESLTPVIVDLYQYWKPGMEPSLPTT